MKPLVGVLIASATSLLASCASYYFTGPQPVDRPDLKRIPRELRGRWWKLDDDGSQPDRSMPPAYIVEKRRIWEIDAGQADTVIDRVLTWREKTDTALQDLALMSFSREENFDSASGRMDTVSKFILRGSVIYESDGNQLSKGSAFVRWGDTIRFRRSDTILHSLGYGFRIRRAEPGLWVLNFPVNDRLNTQGWWQVLLAERKSDSIRLSSPEAKIEETGGRIARLQNNVYMDLDFRAADTRRLLRDSLFGTYQRLVR